MDWSFHLSPEERHLAKVADLDALEQMAVNAGAEIDIASAYERIFEALDKRASTQAPIPSWTGGSATLHGLPDTRSATVFHF